MGVAQDDALDATDVASLQAAGGVVPLKPHNDNGMTIAQQLVAYAEALASFRHDPLAFVMWAYPWRVAGTFLEKEDGPDAWQREQLEYIGAQLRDDAHTPIKMVTSSGNGAGKSSLVSWLIHWGSMTAPDVRGVVTANSDNQLKTKTWSELSKWTHLHFDQFEVGRLAFELTATRFYARDKPMDWRIDAIPNSKLTPPPSRACTTPASASSSSSTKPPKSPTSSGI